MTDNTTYIRLIDQLEHQSSKLSDADKWHLFYLEAWQTAYVGQNEKARPMLEDVAEHAPDDDLREQARATLINILGIGHRYQEAFSNLDQALDELPRISRASTRQHVLAEASQLLTEAGQYDLAINYADQLILIPAASDYRCIGMSIKLDAEFRKDPHADDLLSRLQRGVDTCVANHVLLSADTLRADMARVKIDEGKAGDAIDLLQSAYADMSKLQYQDLASQYDALLAEAYWKQGNTRQAENYAIATVDLASKGDFMEPLISAYQLLYQIAQQEDHLRDALMYHEKFMMANSTHLDDIHEKALAYQVAKQQSDAKKAELDELSKKNQILQLQQSLDHREVETGRLYIALLIVLLGSIALWLYRLKRSQLRFMRMASHDGLTSILNRQHFFEKVEQKLGRATDSAQSASLILIDLDHFKSINDTHGHAAGDHVLTRVVDVCQRYLQTTDVFGRLGGEEFAIFLSGCTAENAIERAEQIRRAIHDTSREENQSTPVSASLGVASTTHHGHHLRHLLAAANEALYQAMYGGYNRVVINIASHSEAHPGGACINKFAVSHGKPGATQDGEPSSCAADSQD
ncbi:GGDEF domain-containing protein [Dyella caseinilytica]|nr:GGDEF domain-containing protein [Dyella caseinilytica]